MVNNFQHATTPPRHKSLMRPSFILLIITIIMVIILPSYLISASDPTSNIDPNNIIYVGQPLSITAPTFTGTSTTPITVSYKYLSNPTDPASWVQLDSIITSGSTSPTQFIINGNKHWDILDILYNRYHNGGARRIVLPNYPNILAIPIKITISIPAAAGGTGKDTTGLSTTQRGEDGFEFSTHEDQFEFLTHEDQDEFEFSTLDATTSFSFQWNLISRCDYINYIDNVVCPSFHGCNPSSFGAGLTTVIAHCECEPTPITNSAYSSLLSRPENQSFGKQCASSTARLLKLPPGSTDHLNLHENDAVAGYISNGMSISWIDTNNLSTTSLQSIMPDATSAQLELYPMDYLRMSSIPPIELDGSSQSFVIPEMYTYHLKNLQSGFNNISPITFNAAIKLYNTHNILISTINLAPLQYLTPAVYSSRIIASSTSTWCASQDLRGNSFGGCDANVCSTWSLTAANALTSTRSLLLTLTRRSTSNTIVQRTISVNYSILISSTNFLYTLPIEISSTTPSPIIISPTTDPENIVYNIETFVLTPDISGSLRIPPGQWKIQLIFNQNPTAGASGEFSHCIYSTTFIIGENTADLAVTPDQLEWEYDNAPKIRPTEYEHRELITNLSSFSPDSGYYYSTTLPPALSYSSGLGDIGPLPLWPKNLAITRAQDFAKTPIKFHSPYIIPPSTSSTFSIWNGITTDVASQSMIQPRRLPQILGDVSPCMWTAIEPAVPTTAPLSTTGRWFLTVKKFGYSNKNTAIEFSIDTEIFYAVDLPYHIDRDEFTISFDPTKFITWIPAPGSMTLYYRIVADGMETCVANTAITVVESLSCPSSTSTVLELINLTPTEATLRLETLIEPTAFPSYNHQFYILIDGVSAPITLTSPSPLIIGPVTMLKFAISVPFTEGQSVSFKMIYNLSDSLPCSSSTAPQPFTVCLAPASVSLITPTHTGVYTMSSTPLTLNYNHWKSATTTPILTGHLLKNGANSGGVTISGGSNGSFNVQLPPNTLLEQGYTYSIAISSVFFNVNAGCDFTPPLISNNLPSAALECPLSPSSINAPAASHDISAKAPFGNISPEILALIVQRGVAVTIYTQSPSSGITDLVSTFTANSPELESYDGSSFVYLQRSSLAAFNYIGIITFNVAYGTCTSMPRIQFTLKQILPHGGSDGISTSRQVTLGWKLPASRVSEMEADPNSIYYKFTLHKRIANPLTPYTPYYTTSLGLLRGTAKFTATYNDPTTVLAIDPKNKANTVVFPETAHSVTLDLPLLRDTDFTDSNGFVIMMSPVDAETKLVYVDNPERYHALWFFDATTTGWSNINICSLTTCVGSTNCNPYTGGCDPITPPTLQTESSWPVSPLFINGVCTLVPRCPQHFNPNPECTECICTSDECIKYTKSVQINMNMATVDLSLSGYSIDKQYLVIESYFRNYLQLFLGGLRTISSDPTYTPSYAMKGKVPYPITADNGLPDEVGAIGFEVLTVNYMNPTITTSPDFTNLLITISIIPNANFFSLPNQDSLVNNRFMMLISRFKQLVQKETATSFAFPLTSYPYLPFNLQFSTINPLFDFHYGKRPSTILTTRCVNGIDGSTGICPSATSTLLAKSPFWSRCPTTPTTPPTIQRITPQCIDFNSVAYTGKVQPQWCTFGWFNYPSVTGMICQITNTVPTTLQWAPTQPDYSTTRLPVGSTINLQWVWDSQHSPSYTIDILISRGSGTYSVLLATVLASKQSAIVPLPRWNDDFDATVTLRCTNVATLQSTPIIVKTTGNNFCSPGQCGEGQICNKTNGQCDCKPNHTSFSPSVCHPQCYNKCATAADCSSDAPLTCGGRCPAGKSGDLCDIDVVCSNNLINGESSICSYNGFQILPPNSTNCSTASCRCNDSWQGADCSICKLTDSSDQSQLCIVTNTNYNSTKLAQVDGGYDCTKCMCQPGFYGAKCEVGAIRGVITFSKPTSPTPFNLQSTSSVDVDGMHFITSDCKDVLIRDMALSLGIDSKFINVTHISQSTTNPSNPTPFSISQTSTTQTSVTYAITPSNGNDGGGLPSLSELTTIWNSLQTNYNSLPIGVTEASSEIGSPTGVTSAQQPETVVTTPECPEGQTCDCTQEEKNSNGGVCPSTPSPQTPNTASNIGLIIGVIVGVVAFVAIVFIMAVLLVRYAKKNQKWCFAPAKGKGNNTRNKKSTHGDDDHLELESTFADPVTMQSGNSTSAASQKSTKFGSKTPDSNSKTAIDLIEIKDHGETLPDGWSKQKHTVTGDQFYVFIKDGEMKSQKNSPVNGDDVEDNGW